MPKLLLIILVAWHSMSLSAQNDPKVFATRAGVASFVSRAPLEYIEAKSELLQGAINVNENKFAFQVDMKSFEGFNSKLQREHFNENYVESYAYPKAYFSGKFVEDVDFSVPGEYNIRAKGYFFIHGVKQERIIEGKVITTADAIKIKSFFSIRLSDHDISIPKIVTQKISENIEVWVDATLQLRQ